MQEIFFRFAMMAMDLEQLRLAIVSFIILMASLSVHEWAHAFAANLLGDPTPRQQGRLTLYPLAHIDLIGTIILPLCLLLFLPGLAIIGWGKPVPIEPKNFKNRELGEMLVGLAGPAANLLVAFGVALLGGFFMGNFEKLGSLVGLIIWINALLAIFNLIPLPPLDGANTLRYLVGMREETYLLLSRWSFPLILILINIPFFQQLLRVVLGMVVGLCLKVAALASQTNLTALSTPWS